MAFAIECTIAPALACDPNANCHRCFAKNPFNGGCTLGGDDPGCVAQRAACRAGLNPLPDPPRPPEPPSPQEALRCAQNPVGCTREQIEDAQYEGLKPIIQAYLFDLVNQARSKKYVHFDGDFISSVQPYYPEIDLKLVTFVTGMNTRHGQNMTITNTIYIIKDIIDLSDKDDRHLLFHELQHSVQYKRLNNDIDSFLKKYFSQAFQEILNRRSFDVHDSISLEQEAIAKSKQVSHALDGVDYDR
jgi:hypothetical protein